MPAIGRITHINTKDQLQTSITLQDGCFGAGMLMRIAALFMNPGEANAAPAPQTEARPKATPITILSSAEGWEASSKSARRFASGSSGAQQDPLLTSSSQPG